MPACLPAGRQASSSAGWLTRKSLRDNFNAIFSG